TKPGEHLGSIPGIVPTPIGEQKGCVFQNRCPYVFKDCASADVNLTPIASGSAYRCLLDPHTCRENMKESQSR
ncbi:MAG: hypothetical protein PVI00_17240, partial [Desulfobacterales bacterium]